MNEGFREAMKAAKRIPDISGRAEKRLAISRLLSMLRREFPIVRPKTAK